MAAREGTQGALLEGDVLPDAVVLVGVTPMVLLAMNDEINLILALLATPRMERRGDFCTSRVRSATLMAWTFVLRSL
jgi:hypothetical protein